MIFSVILVLMLVLTNVLWFYVYKNTEQSLKNNIARSRLYYMTAVQWLHKRGEKKCVEDYLKRNQLKRVAIYGMDFLGKCLYEELIESPIEVAYVIDKKGEEIFVDVSVKIYRPEDELETVDAVIVTAVPAYLQIEKMLKKKDIGIILPLDEIIHQL